MAKCRACDGNRYRSIPILVTYHGNSMRVKERRNLDHLTEAQRDDLMATLVAHPEMNQMILSAAVPCQCAVQEPI